VSRNWKLFLHDMLRFCEDIQSYADGLSREEFDQHRLTYDALIRKIELIGEAANKVPKQVREQSPDIAWQNMIGVRNILIHGYFGLDDDIVWDIIQNKIDPLHASLETLMQEYP